jgi:hypothetical protein
MRSRSMITEVSIIPTAWRDSGTWLDVLFDVAVEVITEPSGIDGRSVCEGREYRVTRHEPPSSQRSQIANRHAVAGYNERLALIEPTHDLAAVVPEFSLGDHFSHLRTVARVRQSSLRDSDAPM